MAANFHADAVNSSNDCLSVPQSRPGTYPCRTDSVKIETTGGVSRAYIDSFLFIGYGNGAIEFRVRFYFKTATAAKDDITIRATQPVNGESFDAGTSPPIFAFVEYEFATKDSAEVFLELTFKNSVAGFAAGQVIAVSDSYRVPKGRRRIGSGMGIDPFVKIDPIQLPDTSSPLELRAWIG